MNEMERKELLERIADEFGFTSECHYEEENWWGYINIDNIDEWKRIIIKDDRISIGPRNFYFYEAGWKRKFKQNLNSLLRNIKERKIKEIKEKKKAIQNCGTTYEC